jgi:hypothetical protein
MNILPRAIKFTPTTSRHDAIFAAVLLAAQCVDGQGNRAPLYHGSLAPTFLSQLDLPSSLQSKSFQQFLFNSNNITWTQTVVLAGADDPFTLMMIDKLTKTRYSSACIKTLVITDLILPEDQPVFDFIRNHCTRVETARLDLFEHVFTASAKALLCFSCSRTLRTLQLVGAQIDGLNHLISLENLSLSTVIIKSRAELVHNFAPLRRLQSLCFVEVDFTACVEGDDNDIFDEIFESIGTSLQKLEFDYFDVTYNLAGIRHLVGLRELMIHVSESRFAPDLGMAKWGELRDLIRLEFAIPRRLKIIENTKPLLLPKLQELRMRNFEQPEFLSNCAALRTPLRRMQVFDSSIDADALRGLRSLEYLDCGESELTVFSEKYRVNGFHSWKTIREISLWKVAMPSSLDLFAPSADELKSATDYETQLSTVAIMNRGNGFIDDISALRYYRNSLEELCIVSVDNADRLFETLLTCRRSRDEGEDDSATMQFPKLKFLKVQCVDMTSAVVDYIMKLFPNLKEVFLENVDDLDQFEVELCKKMKISAANHLGDERFPRFRSF